MAWTTPKTWSAGETLTAANFNAHIRDNLNATGPHLVVRKTADESVVSNDVPQDDDVLLLAVLANEVWQFELHLITTGLFDFLGQITFPSGRIDGSAVHTNPSTVIAMTNLGSSATPSQQWSARADSTSVPRMHSVTGVFANGATPGNLRLQWSQNVSGGTATIVKANSTLWATKLA
jgi:hypothetical protein